MGEAARAVGAGVELPYRGKCYHLSPPDVSMIGLVEARVEQQAWDALERRRPRMLPHEYREAEQNLFALIAAGGLGYGSPAAAAYARSPAGMQYTTYLQLRAGNPVRPGSDENTEITEEWVAEMWRDARDEVVRALDRLSPPDPTPPPAGGTG